MLTHRMSSRGLPAGLWRGAEDPGGHQQGVAGQEKAHQQAGLGEDDGDQAEQAAPFDQTLNVIDAAKQIEQVLTSEAP